MAPRHIFVDGRVHRPGVLDRGKSLPAPAAAHTGANGCAVFAGVCFNNGEPNRNGAEGSTESGPAGIKDAKEHPRAPIGPFRETLRRSLQEALDELIEAGIALADDEAMAVDKCLRDAAPLGRKCPAHLKGSDT